MTQLSISVTEWPAGDHVCSLVRLAGEADLTDTSLRETLAAEIAAGRRRLLVDMTALTFIDSGAIQMIVSAHHVLRAEGGTLALVHPSPAIVRILAVLGVDQVIRVFDSIPEAVTSSGNLGG